MPHLNDLLLKYDLKLVVSDYNYCIYGTSDADIKIEESGELFNVTINKLLYEVPLCSLSKVIATQLQ